MLQAVWGVSLPVMWGAAGVDVFFVISGFIMVHTNRDLSRSAAQFWLDRIIRIVPLYWLLTLLLVVILQTGAAPAGLHKADAGDILSSLFFIPDIRADGAPEPVLSLGWTLNYEMFFYAIFGLTLFLRSMALSVLVLALLFSALAVAGLAVPGLASDVHAVRFYTHPIMLEFVAGAALALAFGRGWLSNWPAPRVAGWALAVAGAGAILATELVPAGVEQVWTWRVLFYGAPALLIVAGVLVLHEAGVRSRGQAWLALGAASYSIYLIHPLVMHPVAVLMGKAGRHPVVASWLDAIPGGQLPWHWAVAVVVACVLSATLAGFLLYRLVEVPVQAAIRRRLRRRPPPGPGQTADPVRAAA